MWKKYGLIIGALVIGLVGVVYYAVQFASYQKPEKQEPQEQAQAGEWFDGASGGGPGGGALEGASGGGASGGWPGGGAPDGAAVAPLAGTSEIPNAGSAEGMTLPPAQPPTFGTTVPPVGTPSAAAPADAGTPPPAPIVISYDGKSYTPASVEIKKGDLVMFVNMGEGEMWPASAMHPTHAVYPTIGVCGGSTFDACAGVPAGGQWSFVFDKVGSWKYHDHLNPSVRGTVNVK
ncbi:hypothetical protein HY623_03225 [Candidatus Uhrbacteria bacterium]|nr:hypothetical protein [Candidatus Uhrbacteria bacterium]